MCQDVLNSPLLGRVFSQVNQEVLVASPSPKVALRRSPRHTAPAAPVRMGLKEKVSKAPEKVRRATASAPSLVTRLPQARNRLITM